VDVGREYLVAAETRGEKERDTLSKTAEEDRNTI